MAQDFDWTDDPLYDGTPIKAVHIQELQKYINSEEEARGLTKTSFTPIETGDVIDDTHLIELKDALDNIRQYDTGSPFTWDTDFSNLEGAVIETNERGSGAAGCESDTSTPPAIQIEELRRKTEMIGNGCSCDCNYSCTCDCNYCTCNCNYCTCNCNHSCTCNCYYSCVCNCNYCYDCTCNGTGNTGQ